MKTTIIATVRNERSTIAAFLDSLLAQTHQPDEILIVDGASNDGTLGILHEYGEKHGVRVISQPCNIAQGRNLGVTHASGTHMAVTDAGCRVEPTWLEEIVACFADNPGIDVVAGNFRFETHNTFEEAVVLATFQPNRDDSEVARFYPSSRSVAFTRAAWEKAGGYPEWLYAAEDTLFNIHLRQLGFQFVFCRRAIVLWRPRETWRALARQRINFSRGNARVGIGTSGYLINLRVHSLILLLLLASPWQPLTLLGALATFYWHFRRHLWPSTVASVPAKRPGMRLRVVVVKEYVRLVNLWGFLLGRWDRHRDPSFIDNQRRYMGVESVEDLAVD
jgi:glycosyltransferase involved in cell wall biosynthesis